MIFVLIGLMDGCNLGTAPVFAVNVPRATRTTACSARMSPPWTSDPPEHPSEFGIAARAVRSVLAFLNQSLMVVLISLMPFLLLYCTRGDG